MKNFLAITTRLLAFSAIMSLFYPTLEAQSAKEMRGIFAQAEAYFLYEEYELANPLYLLLDDDTNFNIKYKIGVCYLNVPGEKEKAIPYLEEAIKHSTFDAKINKLQETNAPIDAYFFLAKAYMINNNLDKGLATLQRFNELSRSKEVKGDMENLDFINQQIQACNTAIDLTNNPIDFSKRMLGSGFAEGAINENPAISYDGNSIIYTEKRGMINVIMYSRKERDVWQHPIDITKMINAGDDCTTCALNADGTELFLYKNDNFDGNIYSSTLENDAWTPIIKLNKNINTKYYESHASISPDGKKLYFTSNREGGVGGLDIYVSELDATGDWGPAINMGNPINTPYNEDAPFISANDSIFFFSSEGHVSMGGYDIFKSYKKGSGWDVPENLGYPINSTDDDTFFQPFNNDKNGYYSITTDYKKKDVFYITFNTSEEKQLFGITGYFSLSDTIIPFVEKNYAIHLIDQVNGDTVDVGYPNKISGRYSFMVSSGSYRLNFTGYGYFPHTVDTTIYNDHPSNIISINATLNRDTSVVLLAEPIVEAVIELPVQLLDLSNIPTVEAIDSSILIRDFQVSDINDLSVEDEDVLYYTVQVMALYNPVDISYFKYITDLKVLYNEEDRFYRYTTGIFNTKEEAEEWRNELFKFGYPQEIFIKKVSK
jgi:Tol biopolymer transport system component